MEGYPFREIETRWRAYWEQNHSHKVDLSDTERKYYVLVMFSYPSEKKLHIGHWWNYGGTDAFARYMKLRGYNVFEPMGFDAFGLPAENYAVKHGIHPAETTRNSVTFIREQLKQIGAMYDWSREVDTSQPEFYKWTQWLFLQLFKTGAAYRKQAQVNWCPSCQTVLANEQVQADGSCERCGSAVSNRDLEQWFFRITDFADALLKGLDEIDWPEATKNRQRHWIGRSEGTEIEFEIPGSDERIRCFTTRADTLFGVTYLVLAPDHDLVPSITTPEQRREVEAYRERSRALSEIERLSLEREKTGCFTGGWAINPANNEKVPVWVADYVLKSYGTGAVMAVPAHDQRDFEFASKYKLPVKWVIRPTNMHDKVFVVRAFEDYGIMYDSGEFDGKSSEEGIKAVTEWLAERNHGRATVSYRLRDWLISRQRYWGAPIPVIHCDKCGLMPVPEADLPVLLPETGVDFTPKGTSPLGACEEFINTTCPKCGGAARRDPDTMDTFVCSSWYYLRYLSTHSHDKPFDPVNLKNWLPVDVYIGGPEHATGHLIYARYISHYLNKLGYVPVKEPFKKLVHQGIITHHGQRMSKSKGNVVNPDEFVDKFGSDCFRMYLMFMGDFRLGGDWSDEGIIGIRRFQNKIWRLFNELPKDFDTNTNSKPRIDRTLNRVRNYTLKEVTQDLESFQFNTAISRLMEYLTAITDYQSTPEHVDNGFLRQCLESFALMLSPLAPHLCEELWAKLGNEPSIFGQAWEQWEESALVIDTVTLVVQVNGKLVDRLSVDRGISEAKAREFALQSNKVRQHISGRQIGKVVFVPDKIINLVA